MYIGATTCADALTLLKSTTIPVALHLRISPLACSGFEMGAYVGLAGNQTYKTAGTCVHWPGYLADHLLLEQTLLSATGLPRDKPCDHD
jgi:hypothetical protein